MIKYSGNTINDWYFDSDNIIKVYRNNAVCYYKLITSGDTPTYQVCYAVVDDISQYTDTEFVDVYDKATDKWYKLNNLNQYEEYGVYGDSIASGSTSRLPQGYTEVEYVENTSTAYIDTNFKPNQDTRITLTAQTVTSQASGKLIGSGAFNKTNAMQFCYEPSSTGSLVVSWGTVAGWTNYSSCIGDFNVHTYDWNKNSFYRDDTLIGSVTYANFQCTDNLGIFRHIQAGDTPSTAAYFKGKIFNLKIFDNGTLVRDLVPCKRDSDSMVGMYDIVNDVFYYPPNYSSYQLVAGSELPSAATYYEGKLAIVDGYEYQYSGSSWVNVGEVSGSTASLPDVPFVLNYNAKNYNASTHTIPQTSGQLNGTDAVAYNNPSNIVDNSADGYITVSNSSMRIRQTNQDISLFNRTNTSTGASLTIVCKAKSTSGENIITNRDSAYNWMYRLKTNGLLKFHGTSETGSIGWNTSNPDIMSVRTYYDSGTKLYYNNWTQNTSTSPTAFTYGSTNTDSGTAGALFVGYGWSNSNEQWSGDFYWVYMSQNTLTDNQVQQVIDYNEGGGGQTEYPLYYDEKSDPLDNLTFSSMTEANEYAYNNCVYDGLKATIDGTKYIFSGDSQGGYEWVEQTSPIPSEYTELQYFTVPKVANNTNNRFEIENELQPNYVYTYEFTPISGFYDSYYGLVTTDDGDTMFKYYGIFKLDNGWGTEFYRNILAFYNYKFSTQSSGNISGAFRYYIDTKATVITKLHNSSDVSQGADLIVENEGYSTYSGVSTTKVDSSWTPVNGVYNMPLFCTNRSFNAYTPNLNFHNFKVEDTQGNLVYDYRPVIRVSDSKVGLFDIVNQQFYYPTFLTLVAGPSV